MYSCYWIWYLSISLFNILRFFDLLQFSSSSPKAQSQTPLHLNLRGMQYDAGHLYVYSGHSSCSKCIGYRRQYQSALRENQPIFINKIQHWRSFNRKMYVITALLGWYHINFMKWSRTSSSILFFIKSWVNSHDLTSWRILYRVPPPPPPRVAQKNGTVDTADFSGLCSDHQLYVFTLLDKASFPHYNNNKIIKFGWELFILWVISYGLSFSGFARFPEFRGTINDKLMANPENDSPWEITHKINSSQSTKFDDLGVIIIRNRCSIQQGEKE